MRQRAVAGPWKTLTVAIRFERQPMTVIGRNGRTGRTTTILTPEIRLPDGTVIRGARIARAIAERIEAT